MNGCLDLELAGPCSANTPRILHAVNFNTADAR